MKAMMTTSTNKAYSLTGVSLATGESYVQLEAPAFKTARERNLLFEKLKLMADLCETVGELEELWRDEAENIDLIKFSDEQNERWYGAGSLANIPIYPLIVEVFSNRKEFLYVRTQERF
jgi:hypothetical protein